MRQNNRDCKIVQDLLPNYIENLTDSVTNEYIEEHIATCEQCAKMLKNMNGEIKLEQINQDKEIKYLKTVRKRVKRTIAIVSLCIIIIAACTVGYVHNKSKLQITNYTFLRTEFILPEKGTQDGNIYGTIIAVIDENGKCKSARMIYKGYDEEELKKRYEMYKTRDYLDTNLQIINNEVHFNINLWNGYTKEEVKKYWKMEYPIKVIEDI